MILKIVFSYINKYINKLKLNNANANIRVLFNEIYKHINVYSPSQSKHIKK